MRQMDFLKELETSSQHKRAVIAWRQATREAIARLRNPHPGDRVKLLRTMVRFNWGFYRSAQRELAGLYR